MSAATVTPDQEFALERFNQLLRRRVQVEAAFQQLTGTISNHWMIRALDSAIADDLRQLDHLGLATEAHTMLDSFRQAMISLRMPMTGP